MSLGPVVSGSRLSKDEVVWSEDLSVGSGSDRVHGAGLKINKNCAGNVFASGSFIVVNVDTLQLKQKIEWVKNRLGGRIPPEKGIIRISIKLA